MNPKTNNGMDPNQSAPGMDSDNNKRPSPDEMSETTGNPSRQADEQMGR